MLDDSKAEQWREAVCACLESEDMNTEKLYSLIECEWPDLCDDHREPCTHEGGVHRAPEWQHKVRQALEQLSKMGEVYRSALVEGEWTKAL